MSYKQKIKNGKRKLYDQFDRDITDLIEEHLSIKCHYCYELLKDEDPNMEHLCDELYEKLKSKFTNNGVIDPIFQADYYRYKAYKLNQHLSKVKEMN